MSDTLERLRRLQKLRPQKKAEVPLPAAAAPIRHQAVWPAELPASAGQPTRLEELVPGEVIETEFGTCYLSTTHYPLDQPRGGWRTGELLAHTPRLLAKAHPQFQLQDDHAFQNAVFLDTETSGLGGGASVYAFMVGVGTFETVKSQESGVKSQESGVRSQESGVRSQESGVRSQESRVRSQESTANSQRSLAPPHPLTPSPPLHFVVRQFFMRHPGEEPALLAAVARTVENRHLTVTFNGRGFDLPLLRTRYFLNRGLLPNGEDMPPVIEEEGSHLDLLYPARRLWKRRLQSCRLIHLEEQVLGLQRSGEDVPGMLIPQLYIDYMRSDDARMMQRVFYHNHEDVLSMVGLATAIYQRHQAFIRDLSGAPVETRGETKNFSGAPDRSFALDGFDWLALGRNYELQSEWQQAEYAYRKALEQLSEQLNRQLKATVALHECFQALSALLKRLARWQEAAECWERWLTTIPGDVAGGLLTPYIELAKYCEWQINDLEQAEMWVGWAMHTAKSQPSSPAQTAELAHRLERIRRKRATM